MRQLPKKDVLVMSDEDRRLMLANIHREWPQNLREKVYLKDGRFHFKVKGVGKKTYNLGDDVRFLGCNIPEATRSVLALPSYDRTHTLVPGQSYEMVICYGEEVVNYDDRTKTNIRKIIASQFGERVDLEPKAEFVFLVSQMFTHSELQMMKLDSLVVLHSEIAGDVQTNQLRTAHKSRPPWVRSWLVGVDAPWERHCGFAFPLL